MTRFTPVSPMARRTVLLGAAAAATLLAGCAAPVKPEGAAEARGWR